MPKHSLIRLIINAVYHKPKGKLKEIKLYRGFYNYYRVKRQSEKMRKYLLKNLKLNFQSNHLPLDKSINFLTGGKYLHQTLLCIYSLFRFLTDEEKKTLRFNVYDDGTMLTSEIDKLKRDFPFINFISFQISDEKVKKYLPVSEFPLINLRMKTYPIMKKLVYVHLNNKGLHPILDSDMLFFSRPDMFLDWFKNPDADSTFFIQDIHKSYGYEDNVIEGLSFGKVPEKINGGFYSFHSDKILYTEIEHFLNVLERSGGASYYVEQALIAIIASKYKVQLPAPDNQYIVYPTKDQVYNLSGILHHYVNVSKEHYFDYSWKQVAKNITK